MRRLGSLVVALIIFSLFLKTTSAEHADFEFHVTPVPETFYPGEESILTLLIENNAKISDFTFNENTSNLLPLLTTAKNLRVELDGDFPVEVETTNPQIAGDLPSGRISKVSFRIKIDPSAEEKEYTLTARISYTYVKYSVDPQTGKLTITYDDDVYVKSVKIVISKKDFDFAVKILNSTVATGRENVVDVEITNTGKNPVYSSYVILNATPPFVESPESMIAYLGDLLPGNKKVVSFKIRVAENAIAQSYPVRFVIRFNDAAGLSKTIFKISSLEVKSCDAIEIVDSRSVLTPPGRIVVREKSPIFPQFFPSKISPMKVSSILSSSEITIPSKGFVEVTLKNVGEEMRDAVAILSFENPLIRVENSPYIGYLGKNESVKVVFNIENLADRGKYRGWIAIKYRNARGDEITTERHSISIEISDPPLRVKRIKTDLSAGLKSEITLEVKNEFEKRLENVELSILSTEITIKPLTTTAFVEDLAEGSVGRVKFRVEVDDDAVLGNYTLYLLEKFQIDGLEVISTAIVPVTVKSRGIKLEIISVEASLYPDSSGEVTIKLKNLGSTLYNTVVMLEVSPPLSMAGESSLLSIVGQSKPGMYFVGTFKSNDTATVRFKVKVDKDAGAGNYPANLKLSYYDAEGYKHETDDFPVVLEVKEKPLITPIVSFAMAAGIIALVTAGIIIRKKSKSN